MVLVSYILDSYVSILQTKLSHREGHEARRVGLETMPLDQHIEGGHGEREPGVKIRPDSMHDLFAMNWLRVFGHAAASRMGHGGGQQRHTSAVQSEKWGDSVAG